MDVSPSALLESGRALVRDYPGLSVHGRLADFEHQLGVLPVGDRRLTAFLGGTIGNLEPGPRAAFLADLRGSTAAGDWLLLRPCWSPHTTTAPGSPPGSTRTCSR